MPMTRAMSYWKLNITPVRIYQNWILLWKFDVGALEKANHITIEIEMIRNKQ